MNELKFFEPLEDFGIESLVNGKIFSLAIDENGISHYYLTNRSDSKVETLFHSSGRPIIKSIESNTLPNFTKFCSVCINASNLVDSMEDTTNQELLLAFFNLLQSQIEVTSDEIIEKIKDFGTLLANLSEFENFVMALDPDSANYLYTIEDYSRTVAGKIYQHHRDKVINIYQEVINSPKIKKIVEGSYAMLKDASEDQFNYFGIRLNLDNFSNKAMMLKDSILGNQLLLTLARLLIVSDGNPYPEKQAVVVKLKIKTAKFIAALSQPGTISSAYLLEDSENCLNAEKLWSKDPQDILYNFDKCVETIKIV